MSEPGPPTANGLWGDDKFADATVIMGDKVWRIHRWVVCQQSDYFMKAYEGDFKDCKESVNKTIDLSNGEFTEEDVNSMLKFLYTHELDHQQKKDPMTTAIIADYFQVQALQSKALQELKGGLRNLIVGGNFVNFKRWAFRILKDHSDTDIEQALVAATASNLQAVLHNSILPAAWNDIVQKHPFFANKVLLAVFPRPGTAGAVGTKPPGWKRTAGVAFDDQHAFRPEPVYSCLP
ncbi:hypothetical protein VPNG_08329 [Cytospora leucostoma]|uniref:BTB domain-containing protein n=1 Tax=Cytospora leucostoma TaxID=1230097 RepID=A0A423W9K5_9PEZI|nr:hypothetical protein VPNG_08329 [Cytospora leucostoma]